MMWYSVWNWMIWWTTLGQEMASMGCNRDLERRIDLFYSICEKILLRTLIFGCFVLELCRFARWLLR
jgi:hypothetical protein